MKLSHAISIFGFALLVAFGGCGARQASIPAWQRNVQQYVKVQGRGDPTVLRDVTLPDTRRGFSMIGADRPAEATDANGVLLGHQEIGGQNWFIYLVGLVRQHQVQEIRLAALNTDGSQMKWKTGSNDREALNRYRQYNDRIWRQRFPDRQTAPAEYLGFPQASDKFRIEVVDDEVRVTHEPSGAQWELRIPPARR